MIARLAIVCSSFCFSGLSALAALRPSPLFGDHAVLQRERPVAIWGEAKPGSQVKVSFGNTSVEVLTKSDGSWMATLPDLQGGLAGDLVFESEDERVVSKNVVTGDVWLCTGQSNIEWTIAKSDQAEAASAATDEPLIRQFKVAPDVSIAPSREVKGRWEVCSPETVGGFTAVGYFMAMDLLKANRQAQGLINCSWGGTAIETWLSAEAVASDPELAPLRERSDKVTAEYPAANEQYQKALAEWEARKKAAEQSGTEFRDPKPKEPSGGPKSRGLSRAYNAMIHPLFPYTIRGDIWYQGEANAKQPLEYSRLLQAHIRDIRSKWGNENLPFIVIQLPGYGGNGSQSWPYLRESQAAAVAALPHTGLVVTIDLGDPKDIHPLKKKEFGQRTASVVRRVAFGEETELGPELISAVREGKQMRIKLRRPEDVILREGGGGLGAFELAGADQVFQPARAVLESGDILVFSEVVSDPVAVRYAWREFPRPVVFSRNGLPAGPFRSDNWPPQKP